MGIGDVMVADVSVVGERGQITIPKNIRDYTGIRPKDSILVKVENGKVIIEKLEQKKDTIDKLKEYYQKYSKLHAEIAKDFESTLGDTTW